MSFSLNKIVLPLYFRFREDNIFHLRPYKNFALYLVIILLGEGFIYYSQILFGPRYFCPCIDESNSIYKNKNDLYNLNKDLEKLECTICLNKLVQEDPESQFVLNESNSNILPLSQRCYYKLFSFHESRIGTKTSYMITKCKHPFHSYCLESWLKQKLECPTCRSRIIYN